jgi:hypothetical protein
MPVMDGIECAPHQPYAPFCLVPLIHKYTFPASTRQFHLRLFLRLPEKQDIAPYHLHQFRRHASASVLATRWLFGAVLQHLTFISSLASIA